ncbi:hypothetical protein CSUI_005627, partial [Cystoisospora suis]
MHQPGYFSEHGGPADVAPRSCYAVGSRMVASAIVDVNAFPLTSPTALALPSSESSSSDLSPAEADHLLSYIPFFGRLFSNRQKEEKGDRHIAAEAASCLCAPSLSSLLPNANACRLHGNVYLTAWRDNTVFCYVIPEPPSPFLPTSSSCRLPTGLPHVRTFYFVHSDAIKLARVLPEYGFLLVYAPKDEPYNPLSPGEDNLFLIQYAASEEEKYMSFSSNSSSETARCEAADDNTQPRCGGAPPTVSSPFAAFSSSASFQADSALNLSPLPIRQVFSIPEPAYPVVLVDSCPSGLFLFAADMTKHRACFFLLRAELLAAFLARTKDSPGGTSHLSAETPNEFEKSSNSKELSAVSGTSVEKESGSAFNGEPRISPVNGARGDSKAQGEIKTACLREAKAAENAGYPAPQLFGFERLPESHLLVEFFPLLPSTPTAFFLDRMRDRFFLAGFDASEGRAWLGVARFDSLLQARDTPDEVSDKGPRRFRFRDEEEVLEEVAQRGTFYEDSAGEEVRPGQNGTSVRPSVSFFPALSRLRLAAKIAASGRRRAAEENQLVNSPHPQSPRQSTVPGDEGESQGVRSRRDTSEGSVSKGDTAGLQQQASTEEAEQGDDLDEAWGCRFYRPVAVCEMARLIVSHANQIQKEEQVAQQETKQNSFFCRARWSDYERVRNNAEMEHAGFGADKNPPKPLEEDVEVTDIALSADGRRLALSFSSLEILILADQEECDRLKKNKHDSQGDRRGGHRDSVDSEENCAGLLLPWLYIPAHFIWHLRCTAALGQGPWKPGELPGAVALPEKKTGKYPCPLVASLRQTGAHVQLPQALGCTFVGNSRCEGEETGYQEQARGNAGDVLLVTVGIKASWDHNRGLWGFDSGEH